MSYLQDTDLCPLVNDPYLFLELNDQTCPVAAYLADARFLRNYLSENTSPAVTSQMQIRNYIKVEFCLEC